MWHGASSIVASCLDRRASDRTTTVCGYPSRVDLACGSRIRRLRMADGRNGEVGESGVNRRKGRNRTHGVCWRGPYKDHGCTSRRRWLVRGIPARLCVATCRRVELGDRAGRDRRWHRIDPWPVHRGRRILRRPHERQLPASGYGQHESYTVYPRDVACAWVACGGILWPGSVGAACGRGAGSPWTALATRLTNRAYEQTSGPATVNPPGTALLLALSRYVGPGYLTAPAKTFSL